MSGPEAWLKAALEAAGGCTAWPLMAAAGTLPPYTLYSRDQTARPLQTHGLTGFAEGMFTLEVYADSYQAAKDIAAAITAPADSGGIHNFTGNGSGATIDHVRVDDEKDGQPVSLDGREVPTFVIELTVFIRWQE